MKAVRVVPFLIVLGSALLCIGHLLSETVYTNVSPILYVLSLMALITSFIIVMRTDELKHK